MGTPELDAREERAQIGSAPGECAERDGIAICTEPAGHGPVHWDKHTQHEFSDNEPALPAPATMRVQVNIGARRPYTYEAPAGTKLRDVVTVPPAWGTDPVTGTVVALGSDYEGEVRRVLSVTTPADPAETTP